MTAAPRHRFTVPAVCLPALLLAACGAPSRPVVERYSLFETVFDASTEAGKPYKDIAAVAVLRRPAGGAWRIPLFWDGGKTWKLRVSPDIEGPWTFQIESNDPALNRSSGAFECASSRRQGGLTVMAGHPSHFARQNGEPVWFMGDTAWGYFTDSDEDNHHRPQAEHYARTRASQGFNAIHSMVLSEQGVGNNGGPPFDDLAAEKINPAYWREVDQRLAFANHQGLSVGMAIAWADKRKQEPFAWRRLPGIEARKRYARYMAARYGAYDVYFLVSGEWHGEIRTRDGATEEEVFGEFVEIGDALGDADPHGRMIGIHPMTSKGSVREFASAPWMSFADYQQNYTDLHGRMLLSARLDGPAVNSEYGYLLRDQDGDGNPDKSNSFSTGDMRFASWDIVTAGGYLVTGFGTTYFGGHRDPGPFDVDAAKNDEWEAQIGHLKKFFSNLKWWKLIPADGLISSSAPRSADRQIKVSRGGRGITLLGPPATAYWAMTIPGETYVIYARGTRLPIRLELDSRAGSFQLRLYDPRKGEYTSLGQTEISSHYDFIPPDDQDWALLIERADRN